MRSFWAVYGHLRAFVGKTTIMGVTAKFRTRCRRPGCPAFITDAMYRAGKTHCSAFCGALHIQLAKTKSRFEYLRVYGKPTEHVYREYEILLHIDMLVNEFANSRAQNPYIQKLSFIDDFDEFARLAQDGGDGAADDAA